MTDNVTLLITVLLKRNLESAVHCTMLNCFADNLPILVKYMEVVLLRAELKG